ncbi:hypothetical protein Goklo_023236 [Gossypium klotzschianum]|uniref:Uncharacterized protein n=1 Tax=Gossypium klotzschianum TaxID=34286 RepID=A0A7J8TQ61_9ROSI|nr:hypothetical protein [Gossypium klotzschianum]
MFLAGTVPIPPRIVVDEDGVSIENPLYVHYEQQDSTLAIWLLSSVSPSLHNQLVGNYAEIKHRCDSLVGCGQRVTMEEQQYTILNGLPLEFDHMVSIITTSRAPTALLDAEAR